MPESLIPTSLPPSTRQAIVRFWHDETIVFMRYRKHSRDESPVPLYLYHVVVAL
jgi:hypothetical protein